ncbi:MAG: hypothetical protein OEM64_11035 [Gammaproteobacteria bacterium]|nr:hypothetical protein [Gammaproteobacteria bacterium]
MKTLRLSYANISLPKFIVTSLVILCIGGCSSQFMVELEKVVGVMSGVVDEHAGGRTIDEIAADTEEIIQQSGRDAAAAEEARAARQREQDQQRQREQQQRQEQQRAQAAEAERQRQKRERERLENPDNLVGSWRSKTNRDGEHGEFHFQGGGGNYWGVFAGRVEYGGAPRTTYRSTIRNLRVTHDGSSWNDYLGEANCQEWFDTMGKKRHGALAKPWEYIRITYYPSKPNESPPQQARVTTTWGCHMSDPPDMTKR